MELESMIQKINPEELLARLFLVLYLPQTDEAIAGKAEWKDRFDAALEELQASDYGKAFDHFLALHNELVRRRHGPVTIPLINASACAILMRRPGKAVELLQKTTGYSSGINLWNLAIAYWQLPQRQIGAAIKRMAEFVKKGPGSRRVEGLLILTALQLYQGKSDEALRSFTQAWEMDPNFCQKILGLRLGEEGIQAPSVPQAMNSVLERLRDILIPRYPERYSGLSENHPAHPSFAQAIAFAAEGNLNAAINRLQSLRQGYPDIGQFAWALAACHLINGDVIAAERLLTSTGPLVNIAPAALWNLACCQFRQQKWQEAERTLQVVIERGAIGGVNTYLALTLLQVLLGKQPAAKETIQKGCQVSHRYHAQLYAALQGLRLERLLPPARTTQLDILHQPEWEQAKKEAASLYQQDIISAAKRLAVLAPSSVREIPEFGEWGFDCIIIETPGGVLSSDTSAREAFQRGVQAYHRGDNEAALSEFQEVRNLIADEQYSTINLGVTQIKVGRRREAIATLDRARQKPIYSGYAWYNLAIAQFDVSDFAGALRSLQEARRLMDPHFFNHIALVVVAEKILGQDRVANEALFQVIRLEDQPSWQLLALTLRYSVSCNDEAVIKNILRHIFEGQPLRSAVHAPKPPFKCRFAGHMQQAFQVFEDASDFDSAVVYFYRVAQWREKELRRAGPAEVGRCATQCAHAYSFLGRAYQKKGDWFNAHTAFRRTADLLYQYRASIFGRTLVNIYQHLVRTYIDAGHLFWAERLIRQAPSNILRDPQIASLMESLNQEIRNRTRHDEHTYVQITRILSHTRLQEVRSPRELEQRVDQILNALRDLVQMYPTASNLLEQWGELVRQLSSWHNLDMEDRAGLSQRLLQEFYSIMDEIELCMPGGVIQDLRPLLQLTSRCLNWTIERAQPPSYKLEIHEGTAYFDQYGQAGLLICVGNTGRIELGDFQIKLRPTRDVFYIADQGTHRVIQLKPDEEKWFDWVISLRSIPSKTETEEAEFMFDVHYSAPEIGRRTHTDRKSCRATIREFQDYGVVYPGAPLRPGQVETLYGREQLLRQIAATISPSGQSVLYFLEGVRQVGKTSILYFLPSYLPREILSCRVNLEPDWPDNNIYRHISSWVIGTLQTDLTQGIQEVDNPEDFIAFVKRICRITGCQLLLLTLDEFGKAVEKIEQGQLSVGFLGFLRSLFLEPETPVGLIFVSSQPLEELRQLPSVEGALIWANVQRVGVDFLDRQSTLEAIRGPLQGTSIQFHQEAEIRIFEETQGYPWHIQSMCNTLMSILRRRKRYYVIPKDVDDAIEELLQEDRLFAEGFCKGGRLDGMDEQLLFGLIEIQDRGGRQLWDWIRWEALRGRSIAPPVAERELHARLNSLSRKQILTARGSEYRIRTPLLARWLKRKKDAGESIVIAPAEPLKTIVALSNDPHSQVSGLESAIRNKKRYLCSLTREIYKNQDLAELEVLPRLVTSEGEWKNFILAVWKVFVEDRHSREAIEHYPDLANFCDEVRLRWNFAHHDPTEVARNAEMNARLRHIGHAAPSTPEDWMRLQVGVLQDLRSILDLTIQQASNIRQRMQKA